MVAMSPKQTRDYLLKVRSLSTADLDQMKGVPLDPSLVDIPSENISDKLSVSLVEELPEIFYAGEMEKRAIRILTSKHGIATQPTIEEEQGSKAVYLVKNGSMQRRKDKNFHRVIVASSCKVTCTCKGYQTVHICSHTVAVAEKEQCLKESIQHA